MASTSSRSTRRICYARAGNPYLGPDRKDWPDNWKRFAALSFAAYEIGGGGGERVPAANPSLSRLAGGSCAGLCALQRRRRRSRPILTVHNIAFQGLFGCEIFNALRLDFRAAQENAIEYLRPDQLPQGRACRSRTS